MAPATLSTEMQNTVRLLSRLCAERFYGKLVISIEDGKITLLRKEENIRPSEPQTPAP